MWEQFEDEILLVLNNAKKISQVLRFYNKFEDDIDIKLFYNENNKCEKIDFKNNKLNDYFIGTIKSKIKEILLGSTAHGIPNLIRNESKLLKSIWAVLFNSYFRMRLFSKKCSSRLFKL